MERTHAEPGRQLERDVALRHPLEPLSAEEIRRAARIVREQRGLSERWRFASIELREPSKQALHEAGEGVGINGLPREANIVCFDRDQDDAVKAVVSLSEERVESWELRPGEHPPISNDEYDEANDVLKRDSRLVAALARRGIADMNLVIVDVWVSGAELVPERYRGRRVGWAVLGRSRTPCG